MSEEKIHRFTHGAMGTVFEIKIDHDDFKYAKSASIEAFRLLDQLEQYLSHYIANSDISRISNLEIGESTQVSYETFECLMQCVELYSLSGGVFDVTIGALYDCWLDEDKNLKSPTPAEIEAAKQRVGLHNLSFDENHFRVGMTGGPVELDLGGFGKGYALDKIAELFVEWDINSYVLNGGQSSMLFADAPRNQDGWPITISDPFRDYSVIKELHLKNTSISSSGLAKGQHIIDPRTAAPVQNSRAAWAFASSAAYADGLSTSFMLLSLDEIEQICTQFPQFSAVILQKGAASLEERLITIGSAEILNKLK